MLSEGIGYYCPPTVLAVGRCGVNGIRTHTRGKVVPHATNLDFPEAVSTMLRLLSEVTS